MMSGLGRFVQLGMGSVIRVSSLISRAARGDEQGRVQVTDQDAARRQATLHLRGAERQVHDTRGVSRVDSAPQLARHVGTRHDADRHA